MTTITKVQSSSKILTGFAILCLMLPVMTAADTLSVAQAEAIIGKSPEEFHSYALKNEIFSEAELADAKVLVPSTISAPFWEGAVSFILGRPHAKAPRQVRAVRYNRPEDYPGELPFGIKADWNNIQVARHMVQQGWSKDESVKLRNCLHFAHPASEKKLNIVRIRFHLDDEGKIVTTPWTIYLSAK